jgi:nucleotide-binding universal stress UspA family protein
MTYFLKHILWATDFSDEAQDALLYAEVFAKTFKSRLTALHVVPDFSPAVYDMSASYRGDLSKTIETVKLEAKAKLEAMAKARAIPIDTVLVRQGSPSKVIVEVSKEEKADLIVMGRKGLSGMQKLFIGSVAHNVLRRSCVPVLVTKKQSGKPQVNKILVPTDFSKQEESEQDYALQLAKGFNASMMLLYVLELFGHDLRFVDELFKDVMVKLQKKSRRGEAGVEIAEDVYKAINAPSGIVDYAETHKFDLIVMSTYVHKLERFLLGSTTEKVISHTSHPVFAIPPACHAE